MKSKKPVRNPARPRRRPVEVDVAGFTIVLEEMRAHFRVFGEAIQELPTRREMFQMRDELRDELRGEMHALRDELRGEMHALRDELRGEMSEMRTDVSLLKTAVLDLSKRIP